MTRRRGTLKGIIAAALAAAALGACQRAEVTQKAPEAGDQAVAQVGDQIVWASDVRREAVAEGLIRRDQPLDVASPLFKRALDEVIDQRLLAAEAVERGLDKSPAAQRRLAAARDRILQDMLVEEIVAKAVTEEAIQGLYQEQLKQASASEEFRVRQIVAATQADAEAVKKQALQPGVAFDALAGARSVDAATRFEGGDLGYVAAEALPPAFAAALAKAKAGDVLGPFQTTAGWVVLKLEDRRPRARLTLAAAKPQIVRFLTYDEVRELLENVRKGSKVKMLIETQDSAASASQTPQAAPPAAPGALTPTTPPRR